METFSALLALDAGNSAVTGELPAQSQWREALMFSLICAWMNGWVNNRDAGYLRRHRAHYDVTVMLQGTSLVLGRWWLFFITAPIKQPWRIRKMNHINSLITLIHITDKKNEAQQTNHSHISWGIIHDDVIKWKHFLRDWPFVRGIHRPPVNSTHKGLWHGALMFSLICVWINDWVNNRETGDLRCYRAHYDLIVMFLQEWFAPIDGLVQERRNSSASAYFSHQPIEMSSRYHGAFFTPSKTCDKATCGMVIVFSVPLTNLCVPLTPTHPQGYMGRIIGDLLHLLSAI